MNSEFVIDTILKNNNFMNYKVDQNSNVDRTYYSSNNQTRILLTPKSKISDTILIAAHEASHVLNYHERKSNPVLLVTLENFMKVTYFLFIALSTYIFITQLAGHDFKYYLFLNLFCLITFICYTSYLFYYLRDEALTEKRAIRELKIWLFTKLTQNVIDEIIAENNSRIIKWIYLKVTILFVGLTIIMFFLRFGFIKIHF
ncbi:hypothetical protein [Paenibacillus monticola]|uniref:Peptidase M48 domain-containing protein n=1 Tax=Paenibacillus monticola TaxID=2666075 RepID=A0A7X2L4E2_9BACL|nr:hypothetical protein [Paenibacillus monticola]MRN56379.1 hypothetical protein [Paenibacillus monticola]